MHKHCGFVWQTREKPHHCDYCSDVKDTQHENHINFISQIREIGHVREKFAIDRTFHEYDSIIDNW